MKKAFLYFVLILFIPFLISQKPPRNGDKPYVEGQIMIKLRSGHPQRQQQMLQHVLADFHSVGLTTAEKLSDRLNIFLLNFNPALVDDERLLKEIKADPDVEMAQFNHFVQLRETIPNDPSFNLQWNMHNTGQTGGTAGADIHGPEGWDLGTSGVTATGDTIIIAVDDDGFDLDHTDLNFWKNTHEIPNNGIDDDSNGYVDDYDGWNSWTNSGNITEADHGTHVTGIASARGNNGIGVSGVNWNVKVMPVEGSATVESIVVAGYAYILEMRSLYNETGGEKGAFIVSTNSSFGVNNGMPADYPIWCAMYDSMGMQGILSAAATANANLNVDEVGDIPTACPSDFLISVTNTDNNDVKNSFAAYGLVSIDLGAPGTSVYSTRQANSYGYKTGTSMATPHVSGAVAYMFSVADADFMTAYHNDPAGMALVIKQYIMNGVDTLPSLQGKTVTGGRLNIYKAAQQMMNPDIIFNPLSILRIMMPNNQESVSLEFSNNSNSPLNYSINYPDTLTWLNLDGPQSGTLNAYGQGSIVINFDTDGFNADTLFTFLTFSYSEGKQFNIPVHLIINSTGSPLTVNVSAAQDSICPGESLQITSDVSGGSGNYTYLWTSNPSGFTSTDSSVTVTPFVTTTYYLNVFDGFPDSATDSVRITIKSLPETPVISSGPAFVDNYFVTTSTYNCTEAANAAYYVWHVYPQGAGTTGSTGSTGEFTWTSGFTGSVQITVIAANDCGNSEISDAFPTTLYSSAGVDENAGENQFIIYPNPAKEGLRFKVSGLSMGKEYSIFIFDATGKQMQEIKVPNGKTELQLNVESYQQGIYFVFLKNGSATLERRKFVIVK
jgi:hypothetical protein